MRVLPAGDRALLVEFDDLDAALEARRRLAAHSLDGVVELVPGARTVLVRLGPGVGGLTRLEAGIVRALTTGVGTGDGISPAPSGGGEARVSNPEAEVRAVVRIPVFYDGEDLTAVADAWGCSPDEVVQRHSLTEWVCAFVGFAPGFPYLVPGGAEGGAEGLPTVPRRATSRPRVPAGSVALAAEYCGVYPRESPGGWQLIGRTDAVLWDTRRAAPALVTAGTCVRFEPVRATATGASGAAINPAVVSAAVAADGGSSPGDRDVSQESRRPMPEGPGQLRAATGATPEKRDAGGGDAGRSHGLVRVLDPGALTLVQDLGRPGVAHLGAGAGGPFDRAAHRIANRLVGNSEHAAALEVVVGGAAFALPARTWVVVMGASGPMMLDDRAIEEGIAVRAERDGAVLRLGHATSGVRYTVAVRGGLEAAEELGSRSRDTLAALGPEPVAAHDVFPIGDMVDGPVPPIDLLVPDARGATPTDVAVRPGPRREWFADAAWEYMLHEEWTVSARADRTGIRLEGPPLERTAGYAGRELPSEGMLPGAIQVSPDGVPTILGPDHPVTGGYPVIAVVTDDTRDRLAQLRPGDVVRLRLATGRP